MGRRFTHEDPATERRLNVLYRSILTLEFAQDLVKFGLIWNVLFLATFGWEYVNTFSSLVVACGGMYFAIEWFGGKLRDVWDEICPCPACQLRRKLEGELD